MDYRKRGIKQESFYDSKHKAEVEYEVNWLENKNNAILIIHNQEEQIREISNIQNHFSQWSSRIQKYFLIWQHHKNYSDHTSSICKESIVLCIDQSKIVPFYSKYYLQ